MTRPTTANNLVRISTDALLGFFRGFWPETVIGKRPSAPRLWQQRGNAGLSRLTRSQAQPLSYSLWDIQPAQFISSSCRPEPIEIPWENPRCAPPNAERKALSQLITQQIIQIKKELALQGFQPGSLDHQQAMARELFEYLRRPTDQGGLGIRFDTTPQSPRRPEDVYRDREAACVEFTTLFLMMAELADLPIVPLELMQSGTAHRELHVAVGFVNPSTQDVELVIDLEDTGQFGPPHSDQNWVARSHDEFLAYFYNGLGAHETDPTRAETYIDTARTLFPDNYLILFNASYYEALSGDQEAARDSLLAAIRDNPNYVNAYWNLQQIAQQLGEATLVDWALQQYMTRLAPTD